MCSRGVSSDGIDPLGIGEQEARPGHGDRSAGLLPLRLRHGRHQRGYRRARRPLRPRQWPQGLRGLLCPARLRHRRVVRRPAVEPRRPGASHAHLVRPLPRVGDRYWPRVRHHRSHRVAGRRRSRSRRRLRHRPHLHRRDLSSTHARAPRLGAGPRGCHRHRGLALRRCRPGVAGRRCREPPLVRPARVAVDVHRRGGSGHRLRRRRTEGAGVTAIPRRPRARRGRRARAEDLHGPGRPTREDRGDPWLAADGPPRIATRSRGSGVRAQADRVGRHPRRGRPAVRRYQRHLLLLDHPLALGRIR